MEPSDLTLRVLDIVGRVSGRHPSVLRPEHELAADLGIDSPKALALLCDLEDELELEVPEEAVARINTLADVLDMAQQCARPGPSAGVSSEV